MATSKKRLNSLVSYVDKTAEEQLVEALRLLPGSVFLTEEDTVDNQSGTCNGSSTRSTAPPISCSSFPYFPSALRCNKKGTPFWGSFTRSTGRNASTPGRGRGFLNYQPIRVSRRAPLTQALLATGSFITITAGYKNTSGCSSTSCATAGAFAVWGLPPSTWLYVACGTVFDGFSNTVPTPGT